MSIIDYRRSQSEIVIDLIRQNNDNKELEIEWVDIGLPVVHVPTPDMPRDTSVTLISSPTSPMRGTKEYFYNRIDINAFLFDGLVLPEHLQILIVGESRSIHLATALSDILQITITPEMIVNTPLPLIPIDGTLIPYTVQMKTTNLAIVGDLIVSLHR